jgi:hypothetical protein
VDFTPWNLQPGIAERKTKSVQMDPVPATIVRGEIWMQRREGGVLLDITGRKVMDLEPGLNGIRHVAPGVYFVRRDESNSTTKVVVQR